MSQRKKIIEVAVSQLGYKEGYNNATKYGKWYGADNQPWCAYFVSWCANQAGIPTSVIPKYGYVPYIYDFFAKRGRWYSRGNHVPQTGDIIIFGTNSHVGLVEKCEGGYVYTIEGNTSAGGNNSNGDGVYRRKRKTSDSWIKGYCIPEYKEDEDLEIRQLNIRDVDSGKMVEVEAVFQNGTNYVKLRDLEKLAPVVIDYDAATKTPTVKQNKKVQ